MKQVLVIDNYDSFTYNLVHYLDGLGAVNNICRNDEINWELVSAIDHILLSPGPGLPEQAGDLLKLIDQFYHSKNMLGICLGHQALAQYFNCELKNIEPVLHGKTTKLLVQDDQYLFKNLPQSFIVGHYHSWEIELSSDSELLPTATNEQKMVMAYRHKQLKLFGVQFHPESILTEHGKIILNNWLESSS